MHVVGWGKGKAWPPTKFGVGWSHSAAPCCGELEFVSRVEFGRCCQIKPVLEKLRTAKNQYSIAHCRTIAARIGAALKHSILAVDADRLGMSQRSIPGADHFDRVAS